MTESLEQAAEGHLASQRLAFQAVETIAGLMQEGWTEKQTAALLNTYLRDHGVSGFFHEAFVWFGDRTRFEGVGSYGQYSPSNRHLLSDDIFILDVAPIYHGYVSDIGYTRCLAGSEPLDAALEALQELRKWIPSLFNVSGAVVGEDIWKQVDERIRRQGYENIHQLYPFSVLGHRVHSVPEGLSAFKWWNFGWQSYWSLLSRGLLSQLLSPTSKGELKGLWAVEPHLGGKGFGAKFEEILIVDEDGARWLEGERRV